MVTFEEISSWPSQALEEATYKLDNKLSREYGIYTCGSREHIKNVEIEQVESS